MDTQVQTTLLNLLTSITKALDPDSSCSVGKEGDQYRIDIQTKHPELFQKYNGEIIQAIQHFLRVAVHKSFPEDKTHFLIDINGARTNRETKLKQTVPMMVKEKVLGSGKIVVLVGLNGYERLLVHQIFADIKGLKTNSVGPSNNRKLIIMPTSEVGSSGMDDSIFWDINNN
jgi:predicted RNA-binding protein Jag